MAVWIEKLKADFCLNFINENRWKLLVTGLANTLKITFFACLMGIAIGAVVAVIRSTHDSLSGERRKSPGRFLLNFFNKICEIYLTVIRGTPIVVQLMIAYYVILVAWDNAVYVAIVAFGINSGAYVAEIMRSGIMSIDKGQMEAGRSLGFNYVQTMVHIIMPQALKNTLPSLANEFIALLKETSVAGYVTIRDLTRGAEIIRGRTFSAYMPLFAVALIYLVLVMIFTFFISKLERRLRSSDH